MDIQIVKIGPQSDLLEQVVALWGENRKTLGLFPRGAFEAYASKGYVLGALNESNEVVGYLIYRKRREKIIIVHLCISRKFRKAGIASQLFTYLKDTTTHLAGIQIKCRRDFEANDIWPKIGFAPRGESQGRSQAGSTLTLWWFDHGHEDLFSRALEAKFESKIIAVIDANVFFDLVGQPRAEGEESRALQTDWLQEDLVLCITDEIFNEIGRQKGQNERQHNRALVGQFDELKYPSNRAVQIHKKLRQFWPEKLTERDESDIRQVSKAIAAKSPYFVTRDNGILDKKNDIEAIYDINVIRPSDIIIQIDELKSELKYQPVRLAGTKLLLSHLGANQEDVVADSFQATENGEKRGEFRAGLRSLLSNPENNEVLLVSNQNKKSLALLVIRKSKPKTLEIPIIRVMKGGIGPVLARHLVQYLLFMARDNKCETISVSDYYLGGDCRDAFRECYFYEENRSWYRELVPDIVNIRQLVQVVNNKQLAADSSENYVAELKNNIKRLHETKQPGDAAIMEDALWPLKIIDVDIPNYIIPIRPTWAQHLIDPSLAEQTLFGAIQELALKWEGVYYRAAKPFPGLQAPSCVLWYVSKDRKFYGSGSVRAYSRIERVKVDVPKKLFRKYKRLGVYEWKHVYGLAGKNIQKKIQAIQFSFTEPLKSPIGYQELQDQLRKSGVKTQLQSPVKIPRETLLALYRAGMML